MIYNAFFERNTFPFVMAVVVKQHYFWLKRQRTVELYCTVYCTRKSTGIVFIVIITYRHFV